MNPKRSVTMLIFILVLSGAVSSKGRSAEHAGADTETRSPLVVWSGAQSKITEPAYMRISSDRKWRDLWLRHLGIEPKDYDELHNSPCIPTVDFGRFLAVAIFAGEENCTQGIRVRSVTEDAEVLRVRFSVRFYAHFRKDTTYPFGILLLPRVPKSVVVEEQGANDPEGKSTWHKRQEFPPLKGKQGETAPTAEAAGDSARPAASFRLLSAQGKPILTDVDIVSYAWLTHTLFLKPGVVTKLKSNLMDKLVQGFPFRVEADGVVCYQGVFTTSMSSISQSCPVIDFDPIDNPPGKRKDQLSITLGYPTEEFFRGKDPRGDPRIRAALAALGKLKALIRATLEVNPDRLGWLVMHTTNP